MLIFQKKLRNKNVSTYNRLVYIQMIMLEKWFLNEEIWEGDVQDLTLYKIYLKGT